MTSPTRIRCALLTTFRNDWASALTLACDRLDCVALTPAVLGIRESPNPFGLPMEERVDVVLMTGYWYAWLESQHADRVGAVMRRLEACADVIVGVDGSDHFELSLPPRAIDRSAVVMKFQGVFYDRDLYNYDVGPWYPGAVWSEKRRRKTVRYHQRHLEKIRLSVPCLMLDLPSIRRDARKYESGVSRVGKHEMGRPERICRNALEALLRPSVKLLSAAAQRSQVHCVAALSHVQRIEVMQLLEGLPGHRGIDAAPRNVAGLCGPGALVPRHLHDDIKRQAQPYVCERLNRLRYIWDLSRHEVVVAPGGYGELGQRHGMTLFAGAALVCQDLSHVEMMFALVDRENVRFCRHDLKDLREIVVELLNDRGQSRRLAREGQRRYAAWAAAWRTHLEVGIEAHVHAAMTA